MNRSENGQIPFGMILLLAFVLLSVSGFLVFRLSAPISTTTTSLGNKSVSILFEDITSNMGYVIEQGSSTPVLNGTVQILGPNNTILDIVSFEKNENIFSLKIPENGTGLAHIDAPGYYRLTTRLTNNGIYRLGKSGTFSGQVRGYEFVLQGRKLPDPEPIPGATLEIRSSNGWKRTITADQEGRFSAEIPPTQFSVTVRSDTHADAYFDDLTATKGETLGRDFILPAGCILEGFAIGDRVTLEGAEVKVITAMLDNSEATAGPRGKFNIPGLSEGMATVQIKYPGYQEYSWRIVIPGDKIGIRKPFSLMPAQPFTLNIQSANGLPMGDAMVRLRREGRTIHQSKASEFTNLNILQSGSTYYFDITANRKNEPPLLATGQVFTMPKEGPGEFTVLLDKEPGTFSGRVSNVNGMFLPGVVLNIKAIVAEESERAPLRRVLSDAGGEYQSDYFAPGKYSIQATHPQWGENVVIGEIKPGETTQLWISLIPR
ncbi:MAG: carboxypeptidase-like regulatory domain-containing protein [Planctomycetota bacterium]|nr:carboxypeptidase-like regulatory domain-containing protein [Planctomycetota bacterium]